MRIRFLHSVQTVSGKAFAKGDVVESGDVPAQYLASWLAGGSAVVEPTLPDQSEVTGEE